MNMASQGIRTGGS